MEILPPGRGITIRAALSSYLALSGVWVLIALGYLVISVRNPAGGWLEGTIIAGTVALLWWIWLLGFKITLTESFLEYRNGFYQSSRIALTDIAQLKAAGVEWAVLGRKIIAPRLLIIENDQSVALMINPKPFKRIDLQRIRTWVNKKNGVKRV